MHSAVLVELVVAGLIPPEVMSELLRWKLIREEDLPKVASNPLSSGTSSGQSPEALARTLSAALARDATQVRQTLLTESKNFVSVVLCFEKGTEAKAPAVLDPFGRYVVSADDIRQTPKRSRGRVTAIKAYGSEVKMLVIKATPLWDDDDNIIEMLYEVDK